MTSDLRARESGRSGSDLWPRWHSCLLPVFILFGALFAVANPNGRLLTPFLLLFPAHTRPAVLALWQRATTFALILLACPSLAGCDGRADETRDASDSAHASSDTRAYSSPPDAGLGFRTILPAGIVVDAATSEALDAVTFTGKTSDDPAERTFLHFAVAPEGTTEAAARETVHTAAESYRVPGDRSELRPVPPPPWALEKYPIRSEGMIGDSVMGWVALGTHAGRWFHIIVQHPAALEREFAPKVDQILDAWRWEDDGEPLREAPAGIRQR